MLLNLKALEQHSFCELTKMPCQHLGISLVLGFAVSFWGTTGVQENIRAWLQVGPELETTLPHFQDNRISLVSLSP